MQLLGGDGTGGYSGYEIGNSVLFPYDHTQYLSWTPGSAGNRKTWTLSLWVKRSNNSTKHTFFGNTDSGGASGFYGYFNDDHLQIGDYSTSSWHWRLQTTRDFRDFASWYHVVIAFDSTESTSTDRVKIWVNGVQETDFQTSSYPSLNFNSWVNNNQKHTLGRLGDFTVSHEFNGYIAEVHFVDGTAYSATDFGEFYNGGNKWRAIQPSGLTYGTNGFYLPFTQDTPNLGTDYSGNGNDWTENGSPVQSGDSPTRNLCTLNELSTGTRPTLSNGNLTMATTSGADLSGVVSTIAPQIGKWYWECEIKAASTYPFIGIAVQRDVNMASAASRGSATSAAFRPTGAFSSTTNELGTITGTTTGVSFATNDILMFALDCDNNKLFMGKNGTWFNSADPVAGTNEQISWVNSNIPIHAAISGYNGQGNGSTFRFASEDWLYTAPTDYIDISAVNLPDPTITDPGAYFETILHTGTGVEQYVTGVGFQPDFTWLKNRDSTDSHMLFDVIRGATNVLHSDSSAAETTEAQTLKSFDSDGFTLGTDVQVNTNTEDYVSWNWLAGGSGVPNTDGSVASTVSVNDDAGSSIIAWDLVSGAHTVGHGQSDTVELIIQKNRDRAVSWNVYHKDVGETKRLLLNDTIGEQTATWPWNDTAPTTSVFSIGNRPSATGAVVGDKMLAYCFRSIPGYSKVFSYTGNGSTDGSFLYLGFKPRWVLLKRTTGSYSWAIFDSQRSEYNVVDDYLVPNSSGAEGVFSTLDFVSNGIKFRTSDASYNGSAATFIGIAFAEYPFGGSNSPLGLAV